MQWEAETGVPRTEELAGGRNEVEALYKSVGVRMHVGWFGEHRWCPLSVCAVSVHRRFSKTGCSASEVSAFWMAWDRDGRQRDRRSKGDLLSCRAAGVCDVGDEAAREGLHRWEGAGRKRKLSSAAVPDDARQPLQCAHVSRDGDVNLLDAEGGVGGADADVAGGDDIDARPEADPVDCSNDGLAAGLEGGAGILWHGPDRSVLCYCSGS